MLVIPVSLKESGKQKENKLFSRKNLVGEAHYSKSHFLSKNSILTKNPTFSRVFHPNLFWQFFSWNQSCQQLKSPKPQHFREFFHPKKMTIFSGNQSWTFGQKMKILNSVRRLVFPLSFSIETPLQITWSESQDFYYVQWFAKLELWTCGGAKEVQQQQHFLDVWSLFSFGS